MKEEAITLLNAFIEETEMEDITETGIIIFLRWYVVLRVKWFIEEMFVTFLFAFTVITCWAKGFGLNLSGPIRVALCFGIIFLFTRFRMLASYKKGYDSTKVFMRLANKYPQHYIYKEESQDG